MQADTSAVYALHCSSAFSEILSFKYILSYCTISFLPEQIVKEHLNSSTKFMFHSAQSTKCSNAQHRNCHVLVWGTALNSLVSLPA